MPKELPSDEGPPEASEPKLPLAGEPAVLVGGEPVGGRVGSLSERQDLSIPENSLSGLPSLLILSSTRMTPKVKMQMLLPG